MAVARGWGRGSEGLVFNGDRESVWEDEKVMEMDGGEGCTTVERYLIPQNCMLKHG